MTNEQDILNYIADLREINDEIDHLEERITKLRDELEGAEDDLDSSKSSASSLRTQIDDMIDAATSMRGEKNFYEPTRHDEY